MNEPTENTIIGGFVVLLGSLFLIMMWCFPELKTADGSILPIVSFLSLVIGGTIITDDIGLTGNKIPKVGSIL